MRPLLLAAPIVGFGLVLLGGLAAATDPATDPAGPGGPAAPAAGAVANQAGYIAGMTCAPQSTSSEPDGIAGFAGDQLTNASTIVDTGQRLGVPEQGFVIAVATAMQESSLHNLDHGDLMPDGRHSTSLGLFQQIAAWGPAPSRLDPAQATTMFFTGGAAGQPGLLDIPHWQDLPLTVAAQAVQQSELPDAYAPWETPARQVVGYLEHHTCPNSNQTPTATSRPAQVVIARATSQLGVPYVWAGGDTTGPTSGDNPHGPEGFDCSGLALYSYAGVGVAVPHQTQAIWAAFPHITQRALLKPGDLLLYSNNGQASGIHHVGIYLGGDSMIEAPQTGDVVKVTTGIWAGYHGAQYLGAVRPGTTFQT